MERRFEVIVYGASGFTGGLVAEYLAAKSAAAVGPAHGPNLRWALAGRNRAKLEAVRARLAAHAPALAELPIVEASAEDPGSLLRMAKDTRVVITTVGPYAKHGEPLVAACVEAGTDYVDLTGEPAFVDAMIHRYHGRAAERGVRIVNSCGFDSVPHDLGVLFTVRRLGAEGPVRVRGYVEGNAQFSGGTWHSAIHAFAHPKAVVEARALRRQVLPNPGPRVGNAASLHRVGRLHAWACPLPTIDPDVVKRSAATIPGYGNPFRYGHHVAVKSLATLTGAALAVGGILVLAQVPPTRRWLLSKKNPGEGPSEARRAKSWFRCTFVGESLADGRRVVTEVSGGDPGYGETAKMLAESALCLARDHDRLPRRGGVLTTAEAMDDVLIERLVTAGIRFEVIEG